MAGCETDPETDTGSGESHSGWADTRACRTPSHLDEHVDVVGDLQGHHFDLVLLRRGKKTFLTRASGKAKRSGGAASHYLVRLQSVSRLPLQSHAQLSDVDLQTSGKVL